MLEEGDIIAAVNGTAVNSIDELRARLSGSIPEYMHPAAIRSMDRLPTFTNGKLDRNALPAPEFGSGGSDGATGDARRRPRDHVEETIAEIWTKLLGTEDIDIDEDFFALGGTSLLVGRLALQLAAELRVTVNLAELLSARTVGAIAALLDDRARAAQLGAAAARRVRLTFALDVVIPQQLALLRAVAGRPRPLTRS